MQACTTWAIVAATYSTLITAVGLCAQGSGMGSDAVSALVANAAIVASTCLSTVHLLTDWDHLLHNIPLEHDGVPSLFSPPKHPRIDDLSDPKTKTMTGFNHRQLTRLYKMFDLEGHLTAAGEDLVPLPTGLVNQRGVPCRFLVHPEEVFLFTLTKIRTGRTNISIVNEWFGGHYQKWGHAYRFMLLYLDGRYKNIIGHQGLTRFVSEFPEFNIKIEQYLEKEYIKENRDDSWSRVGGLRFLPFDIFGFLDDTIDPISQPFSGPRGDYLGAARKREWEDAQRAVYTGYKKLHGLKLETLLLPNGLSTLFGPVSARRSDRGVLAMSGINAFLHRVQDGRFSAAGRPVYYAALGDATFALNLACICSYYRRIGALQLTPAQNTVNRYLKRARITVEKSYANVANEFHVCDVKRGAKIAKKKPYVVEQLRVCHLLLNCKVCLNGDVTGSTNTFGVVPPTLENYLRL